MSEFISTSQLVDRENSEIIYVWKGQSDPLPPIIAKLNIVDPHKHFGFGSGIDGYLGPRIVGLFNIGSIQSCGEMIILFAPGSVILNPGALEVAICRVSENRNALVVSHDFWNTKFPNSAIMVHSALLGSTTGASSGYGVIVKKPFFGNPKYYFNRACMEMDVPWLIASLAAEFERDKSGIGRTVEILRWT
ncbi:MAG: hypothetical protein WCK01_05840 [Candidatus Uhrbacteria bacterium]